MNGLLIDWFYCSKNVQDNIFDKIVSSLFGNGKITKHSYSILKEKHSPFDTETFWIDTLDMEGDTDWGIIHENNFNCSIETQLSLRSFYFKIFHKAICTNKFLHKIGRNDSPLCHFCKKK